MPVCFEARSAEVGAGAVPFGDEKYLDRNGQAVIVHKQVILTGDNLTDAQPGFDNQTQELSPDGGPTSIWLRPGRIDLGMKDAPHAVVTVDGPSTKVYAVISESGGND